MVRSKLFRKCWCVRNQPSIWGSRRSSKVAAPNSSSIQLVRTSRCSNLCLFLVDLLFCPCLRFEDVELLKSFPKGFGELYFFRHVSGKGGIRAGEKFGDRYLYKYWKRACANLNIGGIDLYGGTRHSSVRALRHLTSPERIRLASGHSTSKAFARYFKLDSDNLRETYSLTRQQAWQGTGKALKNGKQLFL